jgi:hypothetical protein
MAPAPAQQRPAQRANIDALKAKSTDLELPDNKKTFLSSGRTCNRRTTSPRSRRPRRKRFDQPDQEAYFVIHLADRAWPAVPGRAIPLTKL